MRTSAVAPVLAAITAMTAIPMFAAAQDYRPGPIDQRLSYEQQQEAYQLKLRDYNDQRAAYDQAQQTYQQRYNSPGRDRRGYHRGIDAARGYDSSCVDQASNQTATGGLIGALAGAAIGSNLADRGSRTEGAVLGAVAGGVIGAGVASSSARCDGRGYYYSYNQTSPYREPAGYDGRLSGQHDYAYYSHSRCRLVVAPAQRDGRQDARYVRVCPDISGRYRLTQ